MTLPNIALIGRTRSGKDQVFKIIEAQGYDVQRVAFGDALKEKFYDIFPEYNNKPKPIEHLIFFGQSMRKINEDVWVNSTMGKLRVNEHFYEQYGLQKPTYVFTDVRQANEVEACKALNCVFIKIVASPDVRIARMEKLGEKVDVSVLHSNTERELESFDYDYIIHNNGSPETLAIKVKTVLKKIKKEIS